MDKKSKPVEILEGIIRSSDFKNELAEINLYAANVKQERHIVALIAKLLLRSGLEPILEKPNPKTIDKKAKYDLYFEEANIEFKFHLDFDVEILSKERAIDFYLTEIRNRSDKNYSWCIKHGIVMDVLYHRPDIFVWVVQSRRIDGLLDPELANICYGKEQKAFLKKGFQIHPAIASFLEELDRLRPFKVEHFSYKFNTRFESLYDFYICDFS